MTRHRAAAAAQVTGPDSTFRSLHDATPAVADYRHRNATKPDRVDAGLSMPVSPKTSTTFDTPNRLLAGIPAAGRRRVIGHCERVELVSGDILCAANQLLRYVYFPTGATISLMTPLDACPGLEVGLVGIEGMVGTQIVLGVAVSPLLQLVQGSGSALRLSVAAFEREIQHNAALCSRLNRFIFVKLHQLALTAACVRYHPVDERLAGWLLMAQDRSGCNCLHATHETIAYMLGVRRVGITKAAASLHRKSLIHYRRGDITILDRAGLERNACECYAAASALYDRTLGANSTVPN